MDAIIDTGVLIRGLIGLFPVLCFLVTLLALDSYKLVRIRLVITVIGLGGITAGVCYLLNGAVIDALQVDFITYARLIGPLVEESVKAMVVIGLVRTHRVGFLVDAAILGFAVGAGFAMIENLYYLRSLADAHVAVWIVRGFGTALLHGGVQSIFAVMLLAFTDRRGRMDLTGVLIPLLGAGALHAAFNQFAMPPIYQTMLVLLVLPPLMMLVFARSERAVEGWLGSGFDADRELLELLDSGNFSDSPHGRFLHALRDHFDGMVVADMICYLRLHVELALRAKGVLMMRENGIEVVVDDSTREKFDEMRYLERSMGPTALRAIRPLLHISRRDLWQLYMLGK